MQFNKIAMLLIAVVSSMVFTPAGLAKSEVGASGFVENKIAAKQGGSVAGKARIDLEKKTGKKIVSAENYLPEYKKNKKLK